MEVNKIMASDFRRDPSHYPGDAELLVTRLSSMIGKRDRWLQFASESLIDTLTERSVGRDLFRVDSVSEHPFSRSLGEVFNGVPKRVLVNWLDLAIFSGFAAGLIFLFTTCRCPFASKIVARGSPIAPGDSPLLDALVEIVSVIWERKDGLNLCRRESWFTFSVLEISSAEECKWPDLASSCRALQEVLSHIDVDAADKWHPSLGWEEFNGNLQWPHTDIWCTPDDTFGWGLKTHHLSRLR